MNISLVLPVKNEIVGLKEYLPSFASDTRFCQILVIDGNSTDGSLEYAEASGCTVVIQKEKGMRLGYLQAYPSILGDAVIVFSPDGNSMPEGLDAIIEKLAQGFDMVIASRYKDGAKSEDDTFLSGMGNFIFTKFISLFGFPYTDAMVMFRGYKRNVPYLLGLDYRRSELYENTFGRHVSWEPLMSIRAAKAGLSICEVGFSEPKRIDQTGAGVLLPATRISHFKAGFFCFLQVLKELVVWNWKCSDGSFTKYKRWNNK